MQYTNPDIESSYQKNDLGRTLYDAVMELKPQKIVEFGVLNAYSTVCMAMALHELGRGKIHAYDLWDEYKHKHGQLSECMMEVMKRGLGKYVQFHYGDFKHWPVEKFDMMHLDISNDGNIIRHTAKKLEGHKGIVFFEGGSEERDSVEWMRKYGKMPISKSGVSYRIVRPEFPSISVMKT